MPCSLRPVLRLQQKGCVARRWLAQTFDYVVRQGWQLDTFGHSGVNAALFALSGMDSIFFSRLDGEVWE